ncbi:MAG TPA: IS66 family transposase [Polyangiaceae bacterium]|nr:IS66 family transposase [Polyangiaceae bacterium]
MAGTTQPLEEVQVLRHENAVLRAQVAWFQKRFFGGGKSEKLEPAQLRLKLAEVEDARAAVTERTEQITYARTKGPKAPRPTAAESFAHVPVTETIEIVPEPVKRDPELYEKIGEERTFEIDVLPPKLVKREIVRPKYRHRLERSRAPVVAAAPARVVPGGYASAGLIAWIVISKYVDHLPLYRQEQMSVRWGAAISRRTMCDWVEVAAMWLEPVYRQMHQGLLAGDYLQADETPVRCNDPDHKTGSTLQCYLWVISRPGADVIFEWRLSRRHEELTSLLAGFKGILQSDAYGAYPHHEKTHAGVVRVGCWAHARRYFVEALGNHPKPARVVLRLIGRLYQLEAEWDEAKVGDGRAALRQKHFARTLRWLHRIAVDQSRRALPKSQLGIACTYLLNDWAALSAHPQHAVTRIDNNLVENAIRPSAIGKKNWLFIGHPAAGQRSAIIYSLVVSCQRHGKDPLAYLRDVLARLPAMTNRDDLAALTPARWQPS